MIDLSGTELGPYRITASLGEGGMAAVYKPYQPAMDRHVALKVLSPQLAGDPQFSARFQQEVRVIVRLEHPHILPVHDFGEAGGYIYLVMPCVEGGTLASRLDGRPLPSSEIRRAVSEVGSALDYAHDHGVIHRDVKPGNVLVDQSGNYLLTDFGLARMVGARRRSRDRARSWARPRTCRPSSVSASRSIAGPTSTRWG